MGAWVYTIIKGNYLNQKMIIMMFTVMSIQLFPKIPTKLTSSSRL